MAQNSTTTIPLSQATRLFEGSYCPLANVIEFCDGEAGAQVFDTEALERHIRTLVDAGIAGFVLSGPSASGNGESSHRLRDEVVAAVASATAEFNRRPDQDFNIPIIVPCGPCGDGVSGLEGVIEQARWAMLYGATHCLVLPPVNLAKTQMAGYFYEVASRAGIPVVLCDNDKFSPGTPSLSSDTIVEIVVACGNHRNFAGMILAAFRDIGKLWRVVRGVGAGAQSRPGGPGRVWVATFGPANKTTTSLALGANAVVSEMSNLAPRTCVRVRDLFASGQHNEATSVEGDLGLAEDWLERKLGERDGIKEAMPLFHGDDETLGDVEVEGDGSAVARILSLESKLRRGGGILLNF